MVRVRTIQGDGNSNDAVEQDRAQNGDMGMRFDRIGSNEEVYGGRQFGR